ncbi:MAG TPA: YhbY family RNA-binding protein [Myxococcota bacterium]|nr:YhbY family RNA-binding protein [Myxococcota bacterium]
MELTTRQRRHLRALGHHLVATVRVGTAGPSEAVAEKTSTELHAHELIKIKVGQGCAQSAKEVAALLAETTDSHLVQVLGRTVLLYRQHPEDPEIVLP